MRVLHLTEYGEKNSQLKREKENMANPDGNQSRPNTDGN